MFVNVVKRKVLVFVYEAESSSSLSILYVFKSVRGRKE